MRFTVSHHTSRFSDQIQDPDGFLPVPSEQYSVSRSASDTDIAKRAYEKFEARGAIHGFDWEDWTAARRELVAETFGHLHLSPSRNVA
jgi:hypothetical protein